MSWIVYPGTVHDSQPRGLGPNCLANGLQFWLHQRCWAQERALPGGTLRSRWHMGKFKREVSCLDIDGIPEMPTETQGSTQSRYSVSLLAQTIMNLKKQHRAATLT